MSTRSKAIPRRLALALGTSLVLLPIAAAAAGRIGGYGGMALGSVGAAGRVPAQLPARPDGVRPVRPAAVVGYYDYGYYRASDADIDVGDESAAPPAPAAVPPPPPPPPAVGSTLTSLPPGCATVEMGGKYLRSCNGAYYEERFAGDRVVYVVVTPQ